MQNDLTLSTKVTACLSLSFSFVTRGDFAQHLLLILVDRGSCLAFSRFPAFVYASEEYRIFGRLAGWRNGCEQDSAVQYSSRKYSTVQCDTIQYTTVQYCAVQYSAEQCSTVQYSTVGIDLHHMIVQLYSVV